MTDRIIERELTHRVVELTIKGKDIVLSCKETEIIRGKIKMEMEFSEKLTGKKKKAMENMVKELQKKFKPGKLDPQAGGLKFDHCPKCGGIVTMQGQGLLFKACSACGAEFHPPVFG